VSPNPHAAHNRFISGPITPTLAIFALPLLTTNLLHSLAGTWGAIWVGQVLGANALTAVATANVIMMMVMGAAMGIGTAAAVAIGQSLGAGDRQAVKRVVGGAVIFVIGFSLVLAIAGWLLTPALVNWMGTPEPAYAFAVTHLRYTCLTMPSIFTYLVMVMMMRGAGDSRTPFKFTVLWIGISVALGPLLLQGSFGLPHMGIAGLGVANLLGSASALCALVVYIYVKRSPIALHGEDIRHLRPDPVLLGLLARRGVPIAMESLVVQGSYFALLALVNSYGAATAAAYSGAAQLWIYVQMPSNALATSMSTMAAMNIGASQWGRVEKIALRGCLMGLAVSAFATAVIYALGDAPLRLFIPEGGEVLEKARHINSHALWGWIALSASMGLFGVIRANGAMLAPMLIFAATMWGIRVPFAVLLRPWLGEDAIWWSFPFGSIFSAAIAWAYYCWGGWRRQALMLAPLDTPVEEML